MYHVKATSFEELEKVLNELSETEELVTINTAGTQAVVVTKDKTSCTEEESIFKKRQKLLEQMNVNISNASGRFMNYD